ncbi:MAG TPA: acetate CoA-transferase subunit alpha [Smithellaceae bacterium]|nr:acetate CoA-transferase subunit alpha [Smithellaceae bacterium]
MEKIISLEKALEKVKDGMIIMIGGFLGVGTPLALVDGLVKKNVRELTIIANDTAMPQVGIGKLVVNKQLKKLIASHIGTNPETGRQMIAGELNVELVPQGTLAERIRCGGAGLGGFLTPTGVGTIVEEGKQRLVLNGKNYLLEMPLHADVALLAAHKADKFGNLVFRRTTRNFNPMMAFAADIVIVEAKEIVETGSIDPDEVMVTGVVVDWLVQGKGGKA